VRLEGDYIESEYGSIILHGWEVIITWCQILSNKVMMQMKYFSGASYLFNFSSFLYQWIILQIKLMTWVSSDVSAFSFWHCSVVFQVRILNRLSFFLPLKPCIKPWWFPNDHTHKVLEKPSASFDFPAFASC
jgi:hypothetical protein